MKIPKKKKYINIIYFTISEVFIRYLKFIKIKRSIKYVVNEIRWKQNKVEVDNVFFAYDIEVYFINNTVIRIMIMMN
jgi:hypothetical protein